MVLSIDPENERVSLGMKQVEDDPWPRIEKEFGIGARHKGRIVWVGDKGIAVELNGVEGFVSKTELPEELQETAVQKFQPGQAVDVIVHSLDEKERRIQLGLVLADGAGEK